MQIKEKADYNKLLLIRNEMTYAEISHLIGFIMVLSLIAFSYITNFHNGIIIPLMVVNVLFHIYPALLQQYNKRRIDILLKRYA